MDVGRGEVFGFLGPNGAGKTTAVKLLLGLARPSGGTGTVLGARLGDRGARRRIGYLPELFRYQAWLTAREVLGLHARLARHRPRARSGETRARPRADGPGGGRATGASAPTPRACSSGWASRVALARTRRRSCSSTSRRRRSTRSAARRSASSSATLAHDGTTVFLNSHLLTEVEQVCHRVAIVDDGQIIEQGTLDALLSGDLIRIRLAAPVPAPVWRALDE